MEEFKLKIVDAIYFDLKGMEAINFLKNYNITENCFYKSGEISFTFSLKEIRSSKFLSYLFKNENKASLHAKAGTFNKCLDIKKLYLNKECKSYDSEKLKDAKIIFYKEINEIIEEEGFFKKDEDSFKVSSYLFQNLLETFSTGIPAIMDYLPKDKKYDFCNGYTIENSSLKKGTFENFKEDFLKDLRKFEFDIDKMKEIAAQEQEETESKIIYNNELLRKWKEGKISVGIDITKDNLTDVIKFIKNEGDEPDFDFNEGMLKAFADENKFRIYMEDGDFAMDVYSGLPEITWKQLIGKDKLNPKENMLSIWEHGKIAIKLQSEEDYNLLLESSLNKVINEHDITFESLITWKNGSVQVFEPYSENIPKIKTYSWKQFIGLELLSLYSSELKNFNSHEWVKFYEDIEGQPNVEWKEGCHNTGIEEIEGFEKRVEDKYGDRKEEIIYRTYMLESDKLRLALKLPARAIGQGGTVIKICNFKNLISKRDKEISNWIQNFASHDDDYYVPKNMMWLLQSMVASSDDFKYLSGGGNEDDDFYYDLVTLKYLDTDFAIPVPIIAEILDVDEQSIYECFSEHPERPEKDEEEFI